MMNWAEVLENFLQSTNAQDVSNYALYLIAVLFFISIIFLICDFWKTFTNSTTGLLTSIGILGTFTGVVIGLLDFDPSNIDESIELLLSGLKTAFITSLAGMAGAIIYRMLAAIILPIHALRNPKVNYEVEPKHILAALNSQEKHLAGLHEVVKGQEKHFNELKKVIAGDEESSLVGTMKLLRSDLNDNNRKNKELFENFSLELWKNLDDLAKVLSESATAQIIDALEKAITNFNKDLREQFGENFKALDASVEKLVVWQANYSKQVDQMIEQYQQGVKAISDVKESVATISQETKVIPENMTKLKEILLTNQHQISELSRHLEVFKAMRDKVVNAIPEMQKHVENSVTEITRASDKASQGYQSLVDSTSDVQETFMQQLEEMQWSLETTVKDLVDKQTKEMNDHFEILRQKVIDISNKSGESLNANIERIDKALEQELSQAIRIMGEKLAGVTGKFADDYERLTKEMKRVVNYVNNLART